MSAGGEVGSIYFDVSLETGAALRQERQVGGMLRRLGDEGDKLKTRFTAVAAAVSAAISAIAVEGLTSKLIAAQRQFDVMFASLKTVTGGAEQASAAFERLRNFAATTPFSVEQAVEAFVKLKALGLDPTERALASFGNTSAAMGKSLTQMIEAVADASTGEFERLKEFGIKSKAEGDRVTFTFRGVATTVRNTSADISEYLTRIGEVDFAGAMSERMKTLDGDISNLQDTLQALYLTISQSGFGDAVAAGVRKASEAIGELTASIREGELTDYFDRLRPIIAAAELAVVALAGAVAGRLVASFIAAAGKAMTAATAMGAATVATRAFSAVLATLGGPIGIAITGLALLALNWDKIAGSAKSAADVSEGAAERIEAALARGGKAATRQLNEQLSEARRTLAEIDGAIANLGAPSSPEDVGTSAILPDLAQLNADRDKVLATIRQIETAITNAYGSGRRPANEGGGGLASRGTPGAPPPSSTAKARGESEAEIRARQDLARIARVDAAEEEADRKARERAAERVREEERFAQQRAQAAMIAQDITNEGDELAQVQAYYQRRADMLTEMRAQELLTEQAHSAAIVANEQAKADALLRIRETEREREMSAQMQSVQAMGQVTGQLLQLLKQAGKERTAIAKAAFLAERAFAVAGIIINTELAASRAGAELGVFGLPLAQTIRATGYASAGLVAGMALGEAFGGGRQYGGPVSAGSLYRINETGEPEMFVGRGGKQYMLPTQGGQVVPADQLGGGGVHVNVHNYSGHPVEVRPAANGRDVEVIVGQAVAEVARQFRQNEGPAWSALTSSSTTRARL
jgi:hypothetical protein